jgi:hypothetical protein
MTVSDMRTILSAFFLLPFPLAAQIFTPQGPELPDAMAGSPYSTFVLATVPDSTVVSGTDVAAMLIQEFPPLALFITDIQGLSYPMGIESIEFTLDNMPLGLSSTCTPSTCRFPSGFSGSMVLTGTPIEPGTYTIDIASYTRGAIDISQLTSDLGIPGLPVSFDLPQGLNTLFDTEFELIVIGPNSIFEEETSISASVFADRAGQVLTVNLPLGLHGEDAEITVMDLSGRKVLSATSRHQPTLALDGGALAPGIHVAIVRGLSKQEVIRFIY